MAAAVGCGNTLPAGVDHSQRIEAFALESRAKVSQNMSRRTGIDRAPCIGMVHSLLLDQAAQLLGVSRRTLYYRIRDGKLRTVRTRCGSQRVLLDSIEALLREEVAPARVPDVGVSSTGPSGRSPEP